MSHRDQESRDYSRPRNYRVAGTLPPDLEVRLRAAGGDPVRERAALDEWTRSMPQAVAKPQTEAERKTAATRARVAELSRQIDEAVAREKARAAGRAKP